MPRLTVVALSHPEASRRPHRSLSPQGGNSMNKVSSNATNCDLLLLSASNYWRWALYPYAFVQVSALARKRGLKVARFDFWGIPKARWEARLHELFETVKPRAVGIHMRNVDSLIEGE